MGEQIGRHHRTRIWAAALVAGGALAIGVLPGGVPPSGADHGAPHIEVLARNEFTADVAAQFRVKTDGQKTAVMNLDDASDVMIVKITIADGVVAPWHTHSGPALLLNTGPGTLTSVLADDCVARDYPPGTAFVDPGQGSLHFAVNNSGDDIVLHAVFLGVEGGPVIPVDPPADCNL
jgi:hypothetical protein